MIAVGTTVVFRLRLDRDAGRIAIDERWQPRYGPAPERGYGWDPVITDEHVFWMDNGRNHTDRTMLGSGEQASPVRLWWARRDDGAVRSVEISGLPYGTESNPPGWDPERGIVVAYDAGNAVVRAWRLRGRRARAAVAPRRLRPRRPPDRLPGHPRAGGPGLARREPAAAARCGPLGRALGPAARALAPRPARLPATGGDQLVVLDLDSGRGARRASTVPSPSQAFLFPAPGFGRDVYYQSLTTIARVVVV